MSFLTFLLTGAITYLVWRIVDQMPDVVFRLGEIQRDMAEIRRQMDRSGGSASTSSTSTGSARGDAGSAASSTTSSAPPPPAANSD